MRLGTARGLDLKIGKQRSAIGGSDSDQSSVFRYFRASNQ